MGHTNKVKWSTVVGITATAAWVVGIPGALGYVIDKMQLWATQSFVLPKVGGISLVAGQYILSWWVIFLILILLFIVSILSTVITLHLRANSKPPQNKNIHQDHMGSPVEDTLEEIQEEYRKRGVDYEEYTNIRKSVRRIVFSEGAISVPKDNFIKKIDPIIFIEEPIPRFKFSRIHCTFVVDKDGNAKVEQLYTVKSLNRESNFWHIKMIGDSYSKKISTLGDIEFRVESLTPGSSIESILMDKVDSADGVALFFVPKILPEEELKFKIQYNWNGWFGELAAVGDTHWSWSYVSACDDAVDVQFTFIFDQRLGDVSCSNLISESSIDSLLNFSSSNVIIYSSIRHPGLKLDWIFKFKT